MNSSSSMKGPIRVSFLVSALALLCCRINVSAATRTTRTSTTCAFLVPEQRQQEPRKHQCQHGRKRSRVSEGFFLLTRQNSLWTRTTTTVLLKSTNNKKSPDALERTAAHLEKLKRQSKHQQQEQRIFNKSNQQAVTENSRISNDIKSKVATDETNENENNDDDFPDPLGEQRETLVQEYLTQPANALKTLLGQRKLPTKGRKPDLARRLASDDLMKLYGGEDDDGVVYTSKGSLRSNVDDDNDDMMVTLDDEASSAASPSDFVFPRSFAGLSPLSTAASRALGQAGFHNSPTPIQRRAIPLLMAPRSQSLILHAQTGSGKTLAYLLPITEQLWNQQNNNDDDDDDEPKFAVILTPTRELAAQVTGVASVLAPPGSVRFLSRPTNVLSARAANKERGEHLDQGGRSLDEKSVGPAAGNMQLIVTSAKTLAHSLYGDGKMPAPPTSKPEAVQFLRNVRYLVLDEVDRLLAVKKSKADKLYERRHEKPAAIVAAAAMRHTLGRVQMVAASATVGRPLRRELARVMGLPPMDCPEIVRGEDDDDEYDSEDDTHNFSQSSNLPVSQTSRAVTIPDTVEHYVVPVEGSSTGKLLTAAYQVVQSVIGAAAAAGADNNRRRPKRKILMVLTRGFGMSTQNAIGALKHFRCQPEPISLLDALQSGEDGTDNLVEKHRQVSGASGIGVSTTTTSINTPLSQSTTEEEEVGDELDTRENNDSSSLLVTGEDTVRGIHLEGLDIVIVVGRANGPDEYTHIAGRTGRAGKTGKVVNVVSQENAAALASWERMLECKFHPLSSQDLKSKDKNPL